MATTLGLKGLSGLGSTITPTKSTFGKTSGFGSSSTGFSAAPPAHASGPSHGIGGFFKNLAGDVEDTVIGLPAGVFNLATHPIGTAENIAKSYKNGFWGKLVTGHTHEAWNDFINHPLGPILDALTLVTLGAGAGARVGILSGEAGTLALRSPEAIAKGLSVEDAVKTGQALGKEGVHEPMYTTKITHKNPAIRARQTVSHLALNKAGTKLTRFSEESRYLKRVTTDLKDVKATHTAGPNNLINAYHHARSSITSHHQNVATRFLLEGIHPTAALDHFEMLAKETGSKVPEHIIKDLTNPKVIKAFENPTKHMEKAMALAKSLGLEEAGVRGLSKEAVELQRWQNHQLLNGAKFEPSDHFISYKGGTFARVLKTDKNGLSKIEQYREDGTVAHTTINLKNASLHDITNLTSSEADAALAKFDTKHGTEHSKTIDRTLNKQLDTESIKKELDAAGINHPTYFPLNQAVSTIRFNDMQGTSSALLLHSADLALHGDHLSASFLEGALNAYKQDVHQMYWENGVHVHPNDVAKMKAKGYKVIKDPMEAHHLLDDSFESIVDHALPTKAVRMLPQKFLDHAAKQAAQERNAVAQMLAKPTTWWKLLMLGLSPRNFVNNVVGNSIMWALRYGGKDSLSAVTHMFMNEPGGRAALADSIKKPFGEGLERAAARKWHPDSITEAGLADTTSAVLSERGASATIQKYMKGVLPFVAKTEERQRIAAMEVVLKQHPLIQAELRKIDKQLREPTRGANGRFSKQLRLGNKTKLHEAMDRVYPNHPEIRRDVSDKIAQGMGNYRDFSRSESFIKDIIPFYSWYRHAARFGIHMLGDRPAVTTASAQLGAQGAEQAKAALGDVPSFLLSYVPIGGKDANGNVTTMNLANLNPFQTPLEIAKAGASLVSGNPSAAAKNIGTTLNPFIGAAIEQSTGTSLLTGAPVKQGLNYGHGGLLGGIVGEVAGNTDISKFIGSLQDTTDDQNKIQYDKNGNIKPPKTSVIKKDWQSILEGWGGANIKTINVNAAQAWQTRIQKAG